MLSSYELVIDNGDLIHFNAVNSLEDTQIAFKDKYDAGYIARACIDKDVIIGPGETSQIPIGLYAVTLDDCCFITRDIENNIDLFSVMKTTFSNNYKYELFIKIKNNRIFKNENLIIRNNDTLGQLILSFKNKKDIFKRFLLIKKIKEKPSIITSEWIKNNYLGNLKLSSMFKNSCSEWGLNPRHMVYKAIALTN